jgi:hypothetical protein
MSDNRAARLLGTGLALWILAWVLGIMFSSLLLFAVLAGMGFVSIGKVAFGYSKN